MSREQDFHKLISQQEQEKKESLWKRIESQTEEEEIEMGAVLKKKIRLSKQNTIIICFAALLLIITSIILIVHFTRKDNSFRYCSFGEYATVETDISIKQYSLENSLNLLYFDWYEEAEEYLSYQYKLLDTDEIICLSEELIDEYGNYIMLYVTNPRFEIDFIESNRTKCNNIAEVKSIEVKWGESFNQTMAYFQYEDRQYYLDVEMFSEPEYILQMISDMIK